VRLRDRKWTPGESPFGELIDPDPRTVWSAIGTPMIDPDGVSDAAVSLTLNRALQRVVIRPATGLELIDSAIEEVERRYQRTVPIDVQVSVPGRPHVRRVQLRWARTPHRRPTEPAMGLPAHAHRQARLDRRAVPPRQ
jgi:hypothetical protein